MYYVVVPVLLKISRSEPRVAERQVDCSRSEPRVGEQQVDCSSEPGRTNTNELVIEPEVGDVVAIVNGFDVTYGKVFRIDRASSKIFYTKLKISCQLTNTYTFDLGNNNTATLEKIITPIDFQQNGNNYIIHSTPLQIKTLLKSNS